MTLQVIGAGFGRTGTYSLKLALEHLELGPCYHMSELLRRPLHARTWSNLASGATRNWAAVLKGYRSGVDWPVCALWRELHQDFPDAKVILTYREPEDWFLSFAATALPSIQDQLRKPPHGGAAGAMVEMVSTVIVNRSLNNDISNPAAIIRAYVEHVDRVASTIPSRSLLVYAVKDAWPPLCGFLGLPIPDTPFPRGNTRTSYGETFARGFPP